MQATVSLALKIFQYFILPLPVYNFSATLSSPFPASPPPPLFAFSLFFDLFIFSCFFNSFFSRLDNLRLNSTVPPGAAAEFGETPSFSFLLPPAIDEEDC